jgi:probable rRNA maturation factor
VKREVPILRVHSQIPRARIHRHHLLKCARVGLRHFGRPVTSIDFIIISARKMAELHRCYLSLPGATDVLAFDLSDNGMPVEGEVYICLDRARRQAAEYGVPLPVEVARLAVHGLLHLAGEEDGSEAGRMRMKRLEDLALRKSERAK